MMRAIGMAAALALLAAAPAWAGALPDGGVTAAEVAKQLQAKGYKAQVGKDSEGDPKIDSGAGGKPFWINFFQCDAAGRCKTIGFATVYDLPSGMTYERANQWNRQKRFLRLFLDDERDPYVIMDLDFEHGTTTEAVANYIDTWAAILPQVGEFIRQ